jgi:hypothetical protein
VSHSGNADADVAPVRLFRLRADPGTGGPAGRLHHNAGSRIDSKGSEYATLSDGMVELLVAVGLIIGVGILLILRGIDKWRIARFETAISQWQCTVCSRRLGAASARTYSVTAASRGDKEWFYADKQSWTAHQRVQTEAVWVHVTCSHCGSRVVYDDEGTPVSAVSEDDPG